MPDKSSVREVLEAIGSSPQGMTDEKDAVALLDIHLGRVQGCNDAQDLAELIDVRDGAKRALNTTFKVRTESVLARSHADPLVNALAPLERLIENMQKEALAKSKGKGPKEQAPLKQAAKVGNKPMGEESLQKVEATTIPVAEPVLPPSQQAIREAMTGGKLAEKLNDPEFLKKTNEWMAKANPSDPQQRQDMVAVIKAMDPAKKAARQKAFEQTFKTTIAMSTKTEKVFRKNSKGEQALDRNKQPIFEYESKEFEFDPAALTAMTDIMAQLPTEHMPEGWILNAQTYAKLSSGSYNPPAKKGDLIDEDGDPENRDNIEEQDRAGMANFNFSLEDLAEGLEAEYTNCAPGDPLEDAKAFDVIVRHECGHKAAVEVASRGLTDLPIAGAWVDHKKNPLSAMDSDFQDLVLTLQNGGLAPTKEDIALAVMEGAKDGAFDAAKMARAMKIPKTRVDPIMGHVVIQVLKQAGSYMCGSAPISAGGRMFVKGGPNNSYFSFLKSSWDKRVSFYQYATPDEWFAEFYATANNGKPSVREAAKNRYPEAWQWLKAKGCIVFTD